MILVNELNDNKRSNVYPTVDDTKVLGMIRNDRDRLHVQNNLDRLTKAMV